MFDSNNKPKYINLSTKQHYATHDKKVQDTQNEITNNTKISNREAGGHKGGFESFLNLSGGREIADVNWQGVSQARDHCSERFITKNSLCTRSNLHRRNQLADLMFI